VAAVVLLVRRDKWSIAETTDVWMQLAGRGVVKMMTVTPRLVHGAMHGMPMVMGRVMGMMSMIPMG